MCINVTKIKVIHQECYTTFNSFICVYILGIEFMCKLLGLVWNQF